MPCRAPLWEDLELPAAVSEGHHGGRDGGCIVEQVLVAVYGGSHDDRVSVLVIFGGQTAWLGRVKCLAARHHHPAETEKDD